MKNFSVAGLLLASTLVTGCAMENKTTLLSPTAPTGGNGTAASTPTGSSSTNSGGASSTASPFGGAWSSASIAGLPVGNCADVKWLITAQTASSVSGTVSASCANGVNVAANLTGTVQSENVINLVTSGTLTAMGLPCQFNLNGTGTRQTGDTMKVDYNGTYCLGTVSGTETLRKFPSI
jgi:hypothetical protein